MYTDAAKRFDVNLKEDFVVYVGSNVNRPGSLHEHGAKRNLQVVMVDKRVGGYEHDISHAPVTADLALLARHPRCTGFFFSILAARGLYCAIGDQARP